MGDRTRRPVRGALAGLRIVVEPQATDPVDMAGPFTIAANGHTVFALANRIVDALCAPAPRLALTVVPSGTRDVQGQLDAGLIDLALTGLLDGGDRFKCSRALTDRYVVVMRRQHPAAAVELSLRDLAGLRHLALTSTGDSTSFLDQALEAAGLPRTMAAGLPFLAAPEALAGSDLVAILPALVAERLCPAWALVTRPLPCAARPVHLSMSWHCRVDGRSLARRCGRRGDQS